MLARTIRHEELDRQLDELAKDPDRFEIEARALSHKLDEAGVDLEISDPTSWIQQPETSEKSRVTLYSQLRSEIDHIIPLDREREAQLARRIEFARTRLGIALEQAGLTDADLKGNVSFTLGARSTGNDSKCALPAKVCRRWSELHALRTEMVERNLYLVLINVERYSHTTASRNDLIQEGSASLYRAVDGFDWRRGLLFRTYAVHWLNQAFRSHLYNFGNTVRVPVYLQKAMKHINLAVERLGDSKANAAQIADEAELAENLVSTALMASRATQSIDAPVGSDEEGASLGELLDLSETSDPYTTDLEDISLEQGISDAMGRLSDRERFVLCKRFGIGNEREHTLAEVASHLGVSLERVRQIQVRAVSKMNTPSLRKAVDPYLN